MSYALAKAAERTAQWCSVQIPLGWLLSALHDKAPALFADMEDHASRMRAMEACLFMIGYDIACLRSNWTGAGLTLKQRAKMQRTGWARIQEEHRHLPRQTIRTLEGKTANLTYAGGLDTDISGIWGRTAWRLALRESRSLHGYGKPSMRLT
jgi:hypothetical protein